MANPKTLRTENTAGNFFVDDACINCGMCYWMAPTVFKELNDKAAVYQQPKSAEETFAACQALVSCPVGSIGTHQNPPETKKAIESFPFLIDLPVYHCGFHSRLSYGATSYLIRRDAGNILVDSPRFATPLVKRIEAMGGVKYLYLTHRDDVGDHEHFRDHFGCERIIHEADLLSSMGKIEIVLKGSEATLLDSDLEIIPVPGHSEGHTVLLYDKKFLFTGDHLAWSEDFDHLYAFRNALWYSWPAQIESMKRLSNYLFEWVLPGHGRRFHASRDEMKLQMQKCIEWMETA